MNNYDKKIQLLAITSLFIALVIIASRIDYGTRDTFRIHLGNSMCLLAGFVLPPLYGGFAAGVGSMLYDFIFYPGKYVWSPYVTLITKFAMGFVAGLAFLAINKLINSKQRKIKNPVDVILGGIIGEIAYIILYGLKTFVEQKFVASENFIAVITSVSTKMGAAVINAISAVIISTIIYSAIRHMNLQGYELK